MTQAIFFRSPSELRKWLQKNHAMAKELLVGYFKTSTDEPSVTWPESVAEALCYGWIDGVRKRIDDERYTIRFTPRKPGSTWSAKNLRTMEELEAAGRVTKAGRAAFEARTAAKSRIYSYEQKEAGLDARRLAALKKNKSAWDFFQKLPASYCKRVSWWVMSAKQEATRDVRFQRLLAACAAGKRLA